MFLWYSEDWGIGFGGYSLGFKGAGLQFSASGTGFVSGAFSL